MKTKYKILIPSIVIAISFLSVWLYIDSLSAFPIGFPRISQNDFYCGSEWIIEYNENMEPIHADIESSIRQTIAEFGHHVNIPWREITISHDNSNLKVTVAGIWNPDEVEYNTISESIKQVDNVKSVQTGPVWCY